MAEQDQKRTPFYVDAGKLEGDGERNYKYCDSFATLDEAVIAVHACDGYHFVDLQYEDVDGVRWNIVLEAVK